ncbi:choline dehydrogenase [Microdochium trichocladiopsis]|uniref:Choline dehydrogenase n=1 Tax=Microdochium trichocladiopsis TaxID=1682393 RepID=A0A9P8XUL8_9PEZI|nr:choline dehydrogenase [Microdochium trichocladiopsis]KAH7018206.1 choline dehydrogenase [Microdochium trichocladiopsis]
MLIASLLLLLAQQGQAVPVSGPSARSLLGGFLNPILEVLQSALSGAGLTQAALGALNGASGKTATYDYVVIGGGTAGNAVAVRLAQAGHQVAVVEAGTFYEIAKPLLGTTPAGDIIGVGSSMLDSNPLIDWEFQTEPQAGANNRKMHYLRGKALGGTSTVSFMVHHRGTVGAYQKWADEVGDDSYTFDNLVPHFQKAVHFTPPDMSKRPANTTPVYDATAFSGSNDGPIHVSYTNYVAPFTTWYAKAAEKLGLKTNPDFSSGSLMGTHYAQVNIRPSDATRSSSASYIYAAKAAGLDNLKVYTQTMARKILFNSDRRATGVQVTSLGVTYTLSATREVVLSAGAFQSPQLLQVSGIGQSSTLSKFGIPVISELAGVGQNMWDHVFFGPSFEIKFDTLAATLYNPLKLLSALSQYATKQSGPLSSNVCEFIGWEKLPAKYRANFSAETTEALAQFSDDWPEVEHLPASGFLGDFTFPLLQQPLDGKQVATVLGALVSPVSRGNVTIQSASTDDLPLINPNWLTAKADQEVAVAWFRRAREAWAALSDITKGDEYWPGSRHQTDAQILAVIQDSLQTVWHASGTCKMGKASDPMAVIDSRARVYGVQALRVVDASSFPLLPPGHPLATIYALAEKIADDMINNSSE